MRRITPIITLSALTAFLSACDDKSPTSPGGDLPPEPPASLALELPDTLTAGRAFTLTVEALDESGARATGWSGTVTLSASAGTISPSTLTLASGHGSTEATLTGSAGEVTITASVGSGSGSATVNAPLMVLSGNAPVRLVLEPSSFLLTGAGDSAKLRVLAYDDAGDPTTPPSDLVWRSLRPEVIEVEPTTAEGDQARASAASASGSAQIVVESDGIVSEPALGLIATPAADAVLVGDSQVRGTIEPVDPSAEYEPGWRYRIRATGAGLEVGKLVIGTGEAPLAGRIVEMTPTGSGDEQLLTIELVPLGDLFSDLRIEEQIPLVEMGGGAGFGGGAWGALHKEEGSNTFNLGPFKCSWSVKLPSLDINPATTKVDHRLQLDFKYDNGDLRLVAIGELKGMAAYRPVVKGVGGLSTDCSSDPVVFSAPLTGPLSVFFGLQVPIGVGFKLDGELNVGEAGFDIGAGATVTVALGIDCPAGGECESVQVFNSNTDWNFNPIIPDPREEFRVKLGAYGYLYAKPYLGARFTQRGSFEVIDARAGLKQGVNLAPISVQIRDTDYASSFELERLATVAPGKSVKEGIKKLGKLVGKAYDIAMPTLTHSETIARSPSGTFTITPRRVEPGDGTELGELAKFIVELDPITYLGMSSIDKVEFFWKKETEGGGFTLENGRPSCREIRASTGQKTFECETDFLEEHEGEQTFYAFAHTRLFGVPLPVPLEVAPDGKATVEVGPEEEECEIPDTVSDEMVAEWLRNFVGVGVYPLSGPGVWEHTDEFAAVRLEAQRLYHNDIAVTLTAQSLGIASSSYFHTIAGSNDVLKIIPINDAYLTEDSTLILRVGVKASGSISIADGLDDAFIDFVGPLLIGGKYDSRQAIADSADRRSIGAGVIPCHGAGERCEPGTTIQIDTILEFPITGADTDWRTYVFLDIHLSALAWDSRSTSTSAEMHYQILQVTDTEGREIPIRQICSASGTDYGFPAASKTISSPVAPLPPGGAQMRRR